MSSRARAHDELRLRIDDRTARCAVIGLGFIGSTVARAIAAAGFPVSGIDRDPAVVAEMVGTPASAGFDGLSDADVVAVAVRVAPQPDGGVDLEPLHAAGAELARTPRRPRLVILVSTVPPGTTRDFAARFTPDPESFVVHAPERLQVDDTVWTLDRIPHVVGGVDAAATELGALFVGLLSEVVVPVNAPEVAELSKLLENSANAVGIALIAEVQRLAHALGVEMSGVTAAAATKPFGYRPFHPGPGIGGHCIPNDLRMLRDAARLAGVPSRLLDATVEVSTEMPADTVDRLAGLLEERGMRLEGSEVLLIGLGFKIGTADTAATPARAVAMELRRRGAIPLGVDSRVAELKVDGVPLARVIPATLGKGRRYPAAVVLTGDSGLPAAALERCAEVVLDAGGARGLDGELLAASKL